MLDNFFGGFNFLPLIEVIGSKLQAEFYKVIC